MIKPPLAVAAAGAAMRAPGPERIAALAAELVEVLGPDRVSSVEAVRRAASTDFAHLSPILAALLPDRPADVVVRPRSHEEIAAAVALAYRHQVPITPRGRGTGNYGQAVPLAGGLVIDLTGCDRILELGEGRVRVEAGASFVAVEAAARRHGQELAMMPTTVGSTIGGFLAGGAGGVGSIEHGWLWDGFVLDLDVVTCPSRGEATAVRVHGDACRPYLHAYGVTGIIATATVRLVPRRSWVAVLASFAATDEAAAVRAGLALQRLDISPRLVSLDEPALVATYPPDEAMPADRSSLRVIAEQATVEAVRDLVEDHGGRVEAVRPDGAAYLSSLAFNHVTLRARKARPDLCHLQVSGEPLVTCPDQVRAALPGGMLHLDGLRAYLNPADPAQGRQFAGLLLSRFHDPDTLYAGIGKLEALGVHVVDPHTWLLGGPALPTIRSAALAADPDGLFNPGKLPALSETD